MEAPFLATVFRHAPLPLGAAGAASRLNSGDEDADVCNFPVATPHRKMQDSRSLAPTVRHSQKNSAIRVQ